MAIMHFHLLMADARAAVLRGGLVGVCRESSVGW